MLKKRLIAVLIIADGQVVQSVQFKHTNVIHWNPVIAVDFFNKWAIDEIVVLDVSRDLSSRNKFYDVVFELSEKCFCPLSVGGWIDDLDEASRFLDIGADKIIINTSAFRKIDLITDCVEKFGSQCVVVSIDVKYDLVCIDRGREVTKIHPVIWAKMVQDYGAGEIFLNDIEYDGNRKGYNLDLIKNVVNAVDIPVIAMGGVLTWWHLVDGINAGAAAVAAANIFHYTEHSTKKAKKFMISEGVDVRR